MARWVETLAATALAAAAAAAFAPAPALHAAAQLAAAMDRAQGEPVVLDVTIAGLRSDRGRVWVGVYRSETDWAAGEEIASAWANAEAAPVAVSFAALNPGVYGIQVFHDANGNGDFDANFLGVPQEHYGFSNNPRPRFRAARWEEAVFKLDAGDREALTIELQGAGG